MTSHTQPEQDEAKKYQVPSITVPICLSPSGTRGVGTSPCPAPQHCHGSGRHHQNRPSRFANPSKSQAASTGNCLGEAPGRDVGWTRILRILFLGTEGVSRAAIHKGRVKNGPVGWCLWVSPGGINCYRWRRRCGDAGEPSLEKLCKGARRGPGGSLQRDIACPVPVTSHVPTLSRAGYTKGGNSQN